MNTRRGQHGYNTGKIEYLPDDTLEYIFHQYGCLYSVRAYIETSLVCKGWKTLLDCIVDRAFVWFKPVYTIIYQAHEDFFATYVCGKWIRPVEYYFSKHYFKSRFVLDVPFKKEKATYKVLKQYFHHVRYFKRYETRESIRLFAWRPKRKMVM